MRLRDPDLAALERLAPAGYALVLHIRLGLPQVSHVTYPAGWVDLYTRRAYQLHDPVAVWALSNTGRIRWSDIPVSDPAAVLVQARRHGLRFGSVVACGAIASRSICSFARRDREHTDVELDDLTDLAARVHLEADPHRALTGGQKAALRQVASGQRYARAAWELGISERALKARLRAAKNRLGARTVAEAVARAGQLRLL
jgi:LuxR family transcriptional regulator